MTTYVFDMDGTICTQKHPDKADWRTAKPITKMVKIINRLFDEGNTIYIFTCRPLSKHKVTKQWLGKYDVKYHHIVFDKPPGDVFVDDKAIKPQLFMGYYK
jgi:hydroxymethylpyrimidine pyrophosphatase-like HAD family hydrolase